MYFLHFLSPPPTTAQLPNTLTPSPSNNNVRHTMLDKFMVLVFMVIVVTVFLGSFFVIFNRRFSERRIRGSFNLTIPIGESNNHRQSGLDPEIVEKFPTYIYSTVKSLKIGMSTLECAVCINEFEDDETLRLIPICNHVFHPECIDAWLVHHSTCPVCRANLAPITDEDISIQIPNNHEPEPNPVQDDEENNESVREPGPKLNINNSVHANGSPISMSKGFSFKNSFLRSHTTGHSVVRVGENLERFTLRLPEEVRNQLVTANLRSTKSWRVDLTPQRSERRGKRIDIGKGRSYMERFARSDRKGFKCMCEDSSTKSTKTNEYNKELGEPSSQGRLKNK